MQNSRSLSSYSYLKGRFSASQRNSAQAKQLSSSLSSLANSHAAKLFTAKLFTAKLFAATLFTATILNITTFLTGCADLNAPGGGGYRHDPYYGSGGYGSGGYDRGYDHPNGYGSGDFYREQERERLRRERYRLEREQDRLERERRDMERERRDVEREREQERDRNRFPVQPPAYQPPAYQPPSYQPPSYQPPGAPPQREERCPSGFNPSERKCTTEERRRGCKDMRLPGGLGCVRR